VRVAFADVWDPAKDNIYPGTVRIDPAYNRARSKLHDLAVIVPAWQPPARPAQLAAPGTIDRVRPKYAVTVGYGDPNRGHRRYATERVVSWNANWLRLVPGSGNSCGGDSGGADLLPGTDTVIALTDLGSCTKDQDTRVDNAAVARFVNSATRLVLRSRAASR